MDGIFFILWNISLEELVGTLLVNEDGHYFENWWEAQFNEQAYGCFS